VGGAFAARNLVFVHHRAWCEIGFAAEDALHLGLLGGHVEVDGSVQISMVRHGHGGHFQLLHTLHERVDAHGSVEERVFGVQVEMDEGIGHSAGNRINPVSER
jgi:hypothetical protein